MLDQLARDIFNDIRNNVEKAKDQFSNDNSNSNNSDSQQETPSSHLKALIESSLKRLNIVTREEFDAQQSVLLRTREKVDALEHQITELEKLLGKK